LRRLATVVREVADTARAVWWKVAVVAVVMVAVLALWNMVTVSSRGPAVRYPEGCAELGYSQRRCDALVAAIAQRVGVDPANAEVIWLYRDDGNEGILHTVTTSFAARIGFEMPGFGYVEGSHRCSVEANWSLLCTNDPMVAVAVPIEGNYRGRPCDAYGDGHDACIGPAPTPEPAAVAAAQPLRLGPIEVPIDRAGDYDVLLGSVTLPNGILSETALRLVDEVQGDFLLDGNVQLEVRSDDGLTWKADDWHPGVEEAEVHLLFKVKSFTAAAALRIASVTVR
jgi:hypothetical protein